MGQKRISPVIFVYMFAQYYLKSETKILFFFFCPKGHLPDEHVVISCTLFHSSVCILCPKMYFLDLLSSMVNITVLQYNSGDEMFNCALSQVTAIPKNNLGS